MAAIFLYRFFLAIFIAYTFPCFSDSYDQFKREWKFFLKAMEFDNKKKSEEYEFYFLSEFSKQQNDRCRPHLPSMDRYGNTRPYSENKVTLRDGTEMSASYVNLSGKRKYQNFIASQAPYKQNIGSFWQMVLENKIDHVVMLTELFENPQWELACSYWPQQVGEKIDLGPNLAITLVEESELFSELQEKIQIRKINLQYKNRDKIITHYWYRNWLNDSVPNQSQTILTLIKTVQNSIHEKKSPILVHCSGGVGRTGVFITLYHLMQSVKKRDTIKLFNLVAYLRWQRPLVGTLGQYKYCYKMYELLKRTDNEKKLGKIIRPT